ncbi:MAG TPA: thiolase family protein [Pseudonocardiaceae bacterium]
MRRALILDAARTPFGRFRGGLSGVRVDDLAALPIVELLRRHGPEGTGRLDPAHIDDVVLGNSNGAGEDNGNIGRMAALLAGLPPTVPGVTVNRLCAAGGEAVVQAARALVSGDADLIVAGGVEGMSRAPFVVRRPDRAFPDYLETVSTTLNWRLVNPRMPDRWTVPLGRAAEQVALELGITRELMDAYALRSHRRARAAWDAGVHDGFVFPVLTPDGSAVRRDESVRPDTSMEKLGRLPSAFSADGPITAGNSSPINDGAVALLLGTDVWAAELGVEPLGEVVGSAVAALEPDRFALAAAPAVRKLLSRLDVRVEDVDLWEINEVFAAVVLAVLHDLPEVDPDRVNVHGGAIAYGNPVGASLARMVVDLCRHLRARDGGFGVAVAGVGVGQGIAVAVRV